MTVNAYFWNEKKGGVSPSGLPIPPAASLVGVPEEFSGLLPIGITTITFSAPSKTVHVLNNDNANDFEVSFDGGTNWQLVASLGEIKEELQLSSILLRSAVAGVAYHIIAGLSSP